MDNRDISIYFEWIIYSRRLWKWRGHRLISSADSDPLSVDGESDKQKHCDNDVLGQRQFQSAIHLWIKCDRLECFAWRWRCWNTGLATCITKERTNLIKAGSAWKPIFITTYNGLSCAKPTCWNACCINNSDSCNQRCGSRRYLYGDLAKSRCAKTKAPISSFTACSHCPLVVEYCRRLKR